MCFGKGFDPTATECATLCPLAEECKAICGPGHKPIIIGARDV